MLVWHGVQDKDQDLYCLCELSHHGMGVRVRLLHFAEVRMQIVEFGISVTFTGW